MVLDLTHDDFVCDVVEVGTIGSSAKRVHRTARRSVAEDVMSAADC